MIYTRRQVLKNLALIAIAGRQLGCGAATPISPREFSTGGTVYDFLQPFLGYCSDGGLEEIDWVLGSGSLEQDVTTLDNLAEQFHEAFDGCSVARRIYDTEINYENDMIVLGDPSTSRMLGNFMRYEDLPPVGTALLRTYMFIDGPEALCLTGRTPDDRALAAESIYVFLMGYRPAGSGDGNVVFCHREDGNIVYEAYTE